MNVKKSVRNKKIDVRFTDEEYLIVVKNADKLNLTLSKYIRQISLNGYAVDLSKKTQEVEPKTLTSGLNILDKKDLLGGWNNLNQLLKYTNTNKQLHAQVQRIIDEIEALVNSFK